jgi:hypothetical protein
LNKAHGIHGIPNECPRYLPRRPLVHNTNFIHAPSKKITGSYHIFDFNDKDSIYQLLVVRILMSV